MSVKLWMVTAIAVTGAMLNMHQVSGSVQHIVLVCKAGVFNNMH